MTNLRADPANVLSIIRDPFEHASLLSQFIADHGRIVVLYDLTKLPNEEQEAVKNLLKTQNEAAQYYKIMRQTKKWAERAKIKAKEPKEATLTKTAEEQREGGSAAAKSGLRALRAKQEQVAREQEYSA